MIYDVAVLGGGAAGLFAAIRAAREKKRAILLEKNRRLGVKISISGGTRCNVTNASSAREIAEAFGRRGRFLGPALAELPPEAVVRFFEDAGVPLKVENDVKPGKVFPVSDRATDVLSALLRRLSESGAETRLEAPVFGLDPLPGGGFEVASACGPIFARAAIVATGGASYPRCGTTGDGYAIARRFGHAIVEPLPALVPLVLRAPWIAALRGVKIERARVAALVENRRVDSREGAILFTHFGLSGPAILDLSSALVRAARGRKAEIEIDFFPGEDCFATEARLFEAARTQGARLTKAALSPPLPEGLAAALLAHAGVPAIRRASELLRDERRQIVRALRACRLEVSGDRGFAQAEVTSGGVSLDEIDPRTCESKKQPGLYFVGEVLDLDGPIGGYNFQAAYSTGWLAGGAA
jgi:predicted Rossmann fold flavoprotein